MKSHDFEKRNRGPEAGMLFGDGLKCINSHGLCRCNRGKASALGLCVFGKSRIPAVLAKTCRVSTSVVLELGEKSHCAWQ